MCLGEAKENVKDEDEEDEVQGFLFSELRYVEITDHIISY